MIVEKIDPNSGAILFKKDEESLTLEALVKRVDTLEEEIKILKNLLKDSNSD